MPPEIIDSTYDVTTLTSMVNSIASTNNFLTGLLYGNVQTLTTETVQLDIVKDGREIAPFIRKNGEALLVTGTQTQAIAVEAPNIRIKQPLTPSQYAFTRNPGQNVLLTDGDSQIQSMEAQIRRDLDSMERKVVNAIEYLVAQSLTGQISYAVNGEEVFSINIPRAAANNITLTTFWNDATPANVRVLKDFDTARRAMSDIPGAEGVAPTDVILGTEASAQLSELVESGNIKGFVPGSQMLNPVNVGRFDFGALIGAGGARLRGEIGGIRVWDYGRVAALGSSTVNMIRPKYAEFVTASPEAERVLYYGAIPEIVNGDIGVAVGRRFAKQWIQNDPPSKMHLLASRPLPYPRRPNASVSMKVISG